MRKTILIAVLACFLVTPVMAAEGVMNVQSARDVQGTADRLEGILKEKGMTVFGRIRHSEAAGKVGVDLRPTELIIFGNPKVGSPLMNCQQSVAIDLPQKALVWQDGQGKVWISYNDPRYLENRHGIEGCEKVLAKVEKALAGITKAAAAK